jgi:hypothetical protein
MGEARSRLVQAKELVGVNRKAGSLHSANSSFHATEVELDRALTFPPEALCSQLDDRPDIAPIACVLSNQGVQVTERGGTLGIRSTRATAPPLRGMIGGFRMETQVS